MSETIEGTVNLTVTQLDAIRERENNLKAELAELKKNEKVIRIEADIFDTYHGINEFNARKFGGGLGLLGAPEYRAKRTLVTKEVSVHGMDEIIEALRKNEEEKVQTRLREAQMYTTQLQENITALTQKNEKEKLASKEAIVKKLDEQALKHKQEKDGLLSDLRLLETENALLRGDEIEASKDFEIKQLKKKIEELGDRLYQETRKSWWDKLIGR